MKVDMSFIPDGESGEWKIDTINVKPRELGQIISLINTGRGVPEGTYKRLVRKGTTVMSNTPDEIRDFYSFVRAGHGNILINGLGLGCVVKCLLQKDNVDYITVIEKSEDVIKLVAPYFDDKRLNIIHADAFEYKPPKGMRYDFVWHDIWDDICSDNLKEMSVLHRKYGRICDWQDSWAKGICQRQKREEKRYEKNFMVW